MLVENVFPGLQGLKRRPFTLAPSHLSNYRVDPLFVINRMSLSLHPLFLFLMLEVGILSIVLAVLVVVMKILVWIMLAVILLLTIRIPGAVAFWAVVRIVGVVTLWANVAAPVLTYRIAKAVTLLPFDGMFTKILPRQTPLLILDSVVSTDDVSVDSAISVPPSTLLLHFNGRAFSTLSAVFDHICEFPEGEARVPLYLEIVQQASNLFQLSSAFSQGLVTAIKQDKSWEIVKWTKEDVRKLLAPLSRHISADRLGRNRREGALSTINRQWGPDITDFFRSLNESEKCLRQIAHIACCRQMHSYRDARRAVNAYVVERLISRPTRHSGRYKTTTADWVALDGADPPDHDVPYARLVAAGVHVGEFGQLVEGPPLLCLAPADPPHDLSVKPGPASVEPTRRKGVVVGDDERGDQTSDNGVASGDDKGDQTSDKGAGGEDGDGNSASGSESSDFVSSASQSNNPPSVDPARKSFSSQTASASSVNPPHESRTHTPSPRDPSPDTPSDISPGLSDTVVRLEE